ncbi:sulfatase [Gaetbulibacter sp. M240]|uniref:sulfatase family protein n=1 Tax=Gaetbulibacter sp. M240 TaxID=3126511 RepID=UPI00374F3114
MITRILSFICLVFTIASCAQEKPNILWITFEDTSPQFIGCYGDENAKTPNLDQLAASGMKFTNAFSTGTVCSPSRSTLITGVRTYALGTGNHRSHYPVPEFIKGFPYYLKQAGYYTSNNAKTDYNVKNAKAFTNEAWHESSKSAGWWKRDPKQPFFSVFNLMDSHQSRTMTTPYETYKKSVLDELPQELHISEDSFNMPPIYNDTPEMRKQFARVYNSIALTDYKIGQILERLEKEGLRESTIIFSFADHGEGMPRGKTNGINYGYQVPFIAWFPEKYKHLSPWKKSGIVKELINFEDLAPTMLALAGIPIPEHMKGRVITDREAGHPEYIALSNDRSDNGIDMTRSITDGTYIYTRNYLPFMPELRYIRYMEIGEIKQLMREDFKNNKLSPFQESLFNPRKAESFYDTSNDLWETKNLIDDPELQKKIGAFKKELDTRILDSRDVMFLPEYEIDKISKNTTPYEFRLDQEKYPFSEIYSIASLSGKQGITIASKQKTALSHTNNIMRFWAITGLKSQNKKVLSKYKSDILKAMTDSYPPVALTAATIAYDLFNDQNAKELLIQFCKDPNEFIALRTINYLLYVSDKTPFIGTIKEEASKNQRKYNVTAACLDFLGSLGLVPNHYDYRSSLTPDKKY